MVFDRRRRRAKSAPLTASKLRKKAASMRSTALPAKPVPVNVAPLEEPTEKLTAAHGYFLVVVYKKGNRRLSPYWVMQ
jgi:hypothetical protein